MPNNQFFPDWVTGDIITAAKLNQMKNNVQPYLGYVLVAIDQGNNPITRYYYLGRVSGHFGFLKVRGILGGHEVHQGRANIDLQFTFRNGFRADGYIMGTVGNADIVVRSVGDGWAYVYLVTQQYALAKLELSGQGLVEIYYNGSYEPPPTGGTTLYQLSSDFANNTHPNTLKVNNGVLRTRYDHQDRFVVDAHLGGMSAFTLNTGSQYLVRVANLLLPSGKRLFLRRLRIFNEIFVLARIETSFATYTSTTNFGDLELDVQMSNVGSNQNFVINFLMFNSSPVNMFVFPYQGYTAEFELR